MPILQVNTNVKGGDIPKDCVAQMSETFRQTIDKPLEYISIHLATDQMMMFGGTDEPCAHAYIYSIGKLGRAENKAHTAVVTAMLAKIGVQPKRMYVVFRSMSEEDVGWNNTTFAS